MDLEQTILLITSQADEMRRIRDMLQNGKIVSETSPVRYRLECADRIERALDWMVKDSVDLVLVDQSFVDNGKMDAIQILHGQAPEIPVILLGDAEDRSRHSRILQNGVQDVLPKQALDGNLLKVAVQNAVEKKGLQQEIDRLYLEIQELRWKEEALRESEKRFRNIALSMVVWLWEMDENGVYTYCSERVENILGYTPEEIVGRHFVDLMPPHEAKKVRGVFYRITEQKKILQDFENWNLHKKGHRICLMSSGVPIIDEEGNLQGYRGVHKNITDQKKAEKALKEANKRLKKLDRLKSDFVSMVSHEIRTPITIMKEGISLCLEGIAGELTDMQHELLSGTLQSVFRLQRLVTELLDLSKIEDGNLELHRSTIDLGDVAQQVQNDYKNQAADKRIRLHLSIPSEPVSVHADRDKIIQVFHNLVSNAIRYTESGGDVWIRVEDTREKEIVCSVSDTGIGIAEENMRDLFSKFKQFGQPKGTDYKGTGLGLAIAKGLVEKHGGRMWVESEPGKGSTFYFSIPRVKTAVRASGKKVKAFCL